jgi:hypothetical protein
LGSFPDATGERVLRISSGQCETAATWRRSALAADDPSGSGRTGGDRPAVTGQAAAPEPGLPTRSLVLRLVIADTEPLSGSVSAADLPEVRVDFSGWISLMSAINELRAGQAGTSGEPSVP